MANPPPLLEVPHRSLGAPMSCHILSCLFFACHDLPCLVLSYTVGSRPLFFIENRSVFCNIGNRRQVQKLMTFPCKTMQKTLQNRCQNPLKKRPKNVRHPPLFRPWRQEGSEGPQDDPKTPPGAPKNLPRTSKNPPKLPPKTHLDAPRTLK